MAKLKVAKKPVESSAQKKTVESSAKKEKMEKKDKKASKAAPAEPEKKGAEKKAEKTEQTRMQVAEEKRAQNMEICESHVSREQVEKAVAALMKHVRLHREKVKAKKEKLDLFEEEDDRESSNDVKDFVQVCVTVKKPPKNHRRSFKLHSIKLTKPFFPRETSDLDICLLVKDKKEAEKLLSGIEVKGLKKIIDLAELRTSYQAFQHRRELASQYDVFLADDRINTMLPKALGKIFFSTTKRPLTIRFARKGQIKPESLEKKFTSAIESTYYRYTGLCCSVRAARCTWDDNRDIVNNVMDCIAEIGSLSPGGWNNIQNIVIKTGNSAALPVYNSLPVDPAELVANDEQKKTDKSEENNKSDKTPKKSSKRKAEQQPAEEVESKKTPARKAKKQEPSSSNKATASRKKQKKDNKN